MNEDALIQIHLLLWGNNTLTDNKYFAFKVLLVNTKHQ